MVDTARLTHWRSPFPTPAIASSVPMGGAGEQTLSSPSFVGVEVSFCIVALIASYELLVGTVGEDGPPKQQPPQPRRRGRDVVGDEPRPAGNNTRPYGRSLSPAGRGRAGSRALTTHIRSNEDTPLIPQSRSGAPQQQQTTTSSTRRWVRRCIDECFLTMLAQM